MRLCPHAVRARRFAIGCGFLKLQDDRFPHRYRSTWGHIIIAVTMVSVAFVFTIVRQPRCARAAAASSGPRCTLCAHCRYFSVFCLYFGLMGLAVGLKLLWERYRNPDKRL